MFFLTPSHDPVKQVGAANVHPILWCYPPLSLTENMQQSLCGLNVVVVSCKTWSPDRSNSPILIMIWWHAITCRYSRNKDASCMASILQITSSWPDDNAGTACCPPACLQCLQVGKENKLWWRIFVEVDEEDSSIDLQSWRSCGQNVLLSARPQSKEKLLLAGHGVFETKALVAASLTTSTTVASPSNED